ncbi:WD repeat-containing protein 74 [Camellia sinensis]|uniref:WD repeat-containing protein 74 n=1 Tax=Camellia sinensis TaxID=4442 RepID=UPI0010367766|nr:WD repeat-containing protein 74 [Camellia sinensis]XP_028118607.1 WD repeat-containing protein 74 [Camellia sinensis]
MPRTTTLECPGCPSLRALTFDVLGLVKVIETSSKQGGGVAKVVERWGDPDSSRCVLAASIDDSKSDPLLAVARKNGLIEVINPLNGDVRVSITNITSDDLLPEDNAIVGLHMLKKQRLELSSRSCTLLTCTTKGHASMRSVEIPKSPQDSISSVPPTAWNICATGNILCSKVDGNENHALFGGKGVEVNVWDLDTCTKIWNAKSPAKNSLGIFTPSWFTCATFLSKQDHRKFAAGTNSHQVRLYDISAQRRPVLSFDFRESPIKAVAEDLDGNTIYIGNGSGDLASVDLRTGKLLGCFLGKCSGSIRSIARHPELPVLASCGLDSYLRLWDVESRQLLSAVFLKQHLTNVVFDSNFSGEELAASAEVLLPSKAHDVHDTVDEDEEEEESLPVKRKKASKGHKASKKLKSKKRSKNLEVKDVDVL